VLWIYGDPGNAATTDRLYVKIGNAKATYSGDIARPRWQQWTIDLAAMGASLSNVTSFTIGLERAGAAGGSGTILLDEIRLYGVAPVPPEEVWIEAESANPLATPFEKFNDPNASGGQYIGKTNTATGTGNNPNSSPAPAATATYSFTVAGGTYRLDLRYNSISQSDGFWVQIPDAVVKTATGTNAPLVSGWLDGNNMRPRDAAWQWAYVVCDDVATSSTDNRLVAEFTLTAGTHTLRLANRDDGTMVDVIVLTRIN